MRVLTYLLVHYLAGASFIFVCMALNSSNTLLIHFWYCGFAGFPTAVATQKSRASPAWSSSSFQQCLALSYKWLYVAGFIYIVCSVLWMTFQVCKRTISCLNYQITSKAFFRVLISWRHTTACKPSNLTRIGSWCKSELLADCTLYEKVNRAREAR